MLVWTESYEGDQYSKKMTADGSSVTVSSDGRVGGGPRTGAFEFHHGPNPNPTYLVHLGSSVQDDLLTVGFAVYLHSTALFGSHALVTFYNGATAMCAISKNGNTGFRAWRGDYSSGVQLGDSSPITFNHSVWYYFEVQVRLGDAGSITVRWDETPVMTLTGVDTNPGAASVFTDVKIGGGGYSWYSDDVYITNEQGSLNTGFLGAVKVEAKWPNGNGNSSQGTGSDGNSTDNYLLVGDGAAAQVADYVDLPNTGDQDTYAFADISGGTYELTSAVKGVFVWSYAIKTDAGARALTPVARLSGTEIAADPIPLVVSSALSGAEVGDVFETKPGGGGWTLNDVNAAEFGFRAS